MKVDRENYEVWMIDYFDGKLNADETAGLMAFIEENPDIKEEFESFEINIAVPDNTSLPEKSALKKTPVVAYHKIDEENYLHKLEKSFR